MNTYYTGDDISISGTLLQTRNGVPVDETLTGTIAVGLLKADRSGLAAGTTQVAGTITSATARTFSAVFPRAQTGSIVAGRYLVEVQVTQDGAVKTYNPASVMIAKGVVT